MLSASGSVVISGMSINYSHAERALHCEWRASRSMHNRSMKNQSAFNNVMDGLDIETYLVCSDVQEGKRLRKYIVKPGQAYPWLM
jgi:hypothetical protein